MKPNRLAAFGLAAGLLAGGTAGLAFGAPVLAGAQIDGTTTPSAPGAPPVEKGRWMRDALAPLVENGTITQTQSDAVIGALEAARPARGPRHGHLRGGHGGAEAAAGALGMTAEELKAALQGGKSLADVAREKGVDPEAVVSAIVADVQARVAEKVSAGRITQEQADRMLAEVTERTRAFVNGEAPAFGRPGRHHRGMAPARAGAAEASSASTTSA